MALQFQSIGGHSHFRGRSGPSAASRTTAVEGNADDARRRLVLVVDGGGSLRTALDGDMIAASAVSNGRAGVVVHGAVRDRTAIAELRWGSRRSGATRARAEGRHGEVDVELVIDGVTVRPGAMIGATPTAS